MSTFSNLKTGTKLTCALLAVAAIILIVAALGHFSLKALNGNMVTLYNDRMVCVEQLGNAQSAMLRLRGDTYKYFLLPEQRGELRQNIAADIVTVNNNIKEYKATYLVQAEKDEIPKFDSAWAGYQQAIADIVKLVNAWDEKTALQSLRNGAAHINRVALDASIENLIKIKVDIGAQVKEDSDRTLARVNAIMTVAGIIGLLFAIALGILIGRSITIPLARITAIAERFATGDLNPEINIDQKDEIGLLAQAFRKIRDALHEISNVTETIALGDFRNKVTVRSEKDTLGKSINLMTEKLQEMTDISKTEDWLKGGQNQLNDRMRGEQDLAALTENVLNFLAGYIGALVGVCYLINDVHKLRLVSSYAYKPTSSKHIEFGLGEGMIGQAALEKKPILFSPVPKDHLSIDIISGMGESVPHSIYVLPLVYEGEALGVLAFGKPGDFSTSQTELLNRVFENIGVSLNTANSRGRLKDLLEKTQLLAEELETQGEELRQSNEELEEKTQILQESEEKLRYQSEELQAIN